MLILIFYIILKKFFGFCVCGTVLWKEAAGRVVFIFFLKLQKFRELPGGEFSDDAAVCGGYS